MARHRHQKNPVKTPAQDLPAAAGTVYQRIASGGKQFIMDSIYRVMTESAALAQEPEFADVTLDPNKAAEITDKWYKVYEKQLAEAKKEGPDQFGPVFDDMRIKVLDELITPGFRNRVFQRLETLQNRLAAHNDPKKLELVIMLKLMLESKEIPWGLCGLIIMIYNRAVNQALEFDSENQEILDLLTEELKEGNDESIDIRQIIESPEKFEEVEQKIYDKKPGLRERLEEKAWELVDQFEDEVLMGKITLSLFSDEELLLPFHRLEEEYGQPITQLQQSPEVSKRTFEVITQTIKDILTPERLQRLHQDIRSTAAKWKRDHNKWFVVLEFESTSLDEDAIAENKFLIATFLGQLRPKGKDARSTQKSGKKKR